MTVPVTISRGWAKVAVVLFAVVVAMVWTATAVGADEGGESDEAKLLVQQAIALIVNTPEDLMAVQERVGDAIEAPHQEGVDASLVARAARAVAEADLTSARDLLQRAIGAGPYVRDGMPEPVGETAGQVGKPVFATGEQTGTTVVLDEFVPERRLDGGERILLAVSALLTVVGLWLSWRWRPRDTVRRLPRLPRLPRQEAR
jgi:hypothetical protein